MADPVNPESLDAAATLAYRELRAIAHHRLMARGPQGTLSTTALVHEAYLKLADSPHTGWSERSHFLAIASLAMRHVLVDRARERGAIKRGGERQRVTLDEADLAVETESDVLLQLDEALDRLAAFDSRLAKVVECRFFGGLSEQETADALGLTARTVRRDWVKARVLLRRALES
jgi:RNA polymerase sigma factor (TIGR02999 family)